MSTRDLRAKLVLDGDNAGLAAAVSQSEAELRKLQESSAKVQVLAGAVESAKAARAAMVEARQAAQALDEQLAAAKGAGAGADAMRILERAVRDANREVSASEAAWSKSRTALDTARAAAAAAGVDTKALASEQGRLKSALDTAAQALAANNKALSDAQAATAAKAAADKAAAAEEERLARIVAASVEKQKAAAQALLQAEKEAAAEAEARSRAAIAAREREAAAAAEFARRMKQSMTDAYQAIGFRGAAEITGEIQRVNSALGVLARDAKVTGAEFDRAWAAGQDRIKALQAELGGIPPQLDAFSDKLAPIAGAIAGAFGVTEVARMATEFDSLNRSMQAIAGQQAAAEVGYITAAASRLGLELGSTSKAYVSWLASVKGTSLEGEQARQIFEAVAGSMAKLGKSSADTSNALLALGQMVGKDVVSMEELRGQLAEALPGAMQAAADGAGVTVAQLTKMVESGTVLAEDLLPGMATQLQKLYGTGAQVQGYAASWNGLVSAVSEAVGRIGQAEIVTAAAGVAFGALRETVLVLGTGALTAAEGIGLLAKSVGAVAGAIQSGNWGQLREEISRMASESAARINELASKTQIAQGVQAAFGASVRDAAAEAERAAPAWLAIRGAYTEVADAAKKYTEQTKATGEASTAEAKAAAEIAQLLGTEAQAREAAARAAEVEAEGKRKLAEALDAEAKVSASQVAAMEAQAAAVVAAGQKISEAKKKEIDELRESNKLKAEAATKAQAEADAAQIRAAAAKTEVLANQDNARSLDALRAEMQRTAQAARDMQEAQAAGKATKDQVRAADIEAAQAARLYRDSLADTVTSIQAKAAAERAAVSVAERSRSLQLAQIDTQIAIAQARGRDLEVQALQIERARVEVELAGLKARALRAEADAQIALVAAKRAELSASGQLTEVKRLELDAQLAAAKAKQVDAQIAEELASRSRQLAEVVRSSGDAMRGAAGHADKLSGSWNTAADAADRLAASAGAVDRATNTVNRQVTNAGVNVYQEAINMGLNDAEAKKMVEINPYYVSKANAEAQRRAAGDGGLTFGADDYAAVTREYLQLAAAEARRLVSEEARKNPTSTSNTWGPAPKAVTVNINLNGRTTPVQVTDQSQADALVRALQQAQAAQS